MTFLQVDLFYDGVGKKDEAERCCDEETSSRLIGGAAPVAAV